ncbi:hypothetical protein SteCoe_7799 [Stentor coeruleus]|uniref:Macro domain-containing protein n=1 Tax=Stentor coeruleus TaxID=5963 RepID=A0A1R2CLM0_9CILI|nr:hypothetical protein SteCoe_7799 [Stentor coeruleus]
MASSNRNSGIQSEFTYNHVSISVLQIDITTVNTDAIVNAANDRLEHGGGVAAAISTKGGYTIQSESSKYIKEHGRLKTGDAAVTSAGNLPCKYVIHAVGPIWRNGHHQEDELLESAIYKSLIKADEIKAKSIAIPAISSGIFGYPKPRCAVVMIRTVKKYIDERNSEECSLRDIRLTNFDYETTNLMEKQLEKFSANPNEEIILESLPQVNNEIRARKHNEEESKSEIRTNAVFPKGKKNVGDKKVDSKTDEKNSNDSRNCKCNLL